MEKQASLSPVPGPGFGTGPKHKGSLVASSEKGGASDVTVPVQQGRDARVPAHVLNNATALFSAGDSHGAAKSKRPFTGTVLTRALRHDGRSDTIGSPPLQAEPRAERPSHRQSGGTLGRSLFDREQPSVQKVVTSLLDPHPVIVPPPGSRMAFAGANSPVMAHMFRALPSLEDTLLRRARAPLCLFNYWQYLTDIEAGSEELEFWLSMSDYETLYRRFVNDGVSIPPSPAVDSQSARRRNGRIESGALGQPGMPNSTVGDDRLLMSQHMETFDTETRELDLYLMDLSRQTTKAAKDSACTVHRQCTQAHCPFTSIHAASRPTLNAPARDVRKRGVRGFFGRIFSGESPAEARDAACNHDDEGTQQSRPLLSMAAQEDGPAAPAPTGQEMQRSAERLYFHYLLSGSPSELRVSPQMREEIASRVEKDQRFDAPLFAPAKRHAYEAMRHESHLRFLRERLLHNITRGTAAPRIALGLTLIFVALTFQFTLLFLDVKPKAWRWLPLAALWPGFAYAFAGITRLDPFMAVFGRYESTAWSFGRVQDSTIRHSHLKRAALQLAISAGIAAIISLVLFLVPGVRL